MRAPWSEKLNAEASTAIHVFHASIGCAQAVPAKSLAMVRCAIHVPKLQVFEIKRLYVDKTL
jgi:hypothetical protein